MKKILIISPHFPPSNLAAVHRSRLFAMHLPAFGWEPVILTVHEKFYQETLDNDLLQLIPENLRIEKVSASKLPMLGIVKDIGLRAFYQLAKRAIKLIKKEKVEFLYIPIPSFYTALLGRFLHEKTGIKYGIDYIDPWVYTLTGKESKYYKHWLTVQLAKFLEPIAVKKASLITGVAEGYYKGLQERNPHLLKQAIFGAMPYGGEVADHEKLKTLHLQPYLFTNKIEKIQLVYAGAMLPKAYGPLEAIFQAITENSKSFQNLEIHFIGTGSAANDANSFTIRPLAEKYNLWQSVVFEYPKRIPYLDVLIHLQIADGVFILGSTEPHYTPSKTYQGVLSEKPILAVLHQESTAVDILRESKAGVVLAFNGEHDLEKIKKGFLNVWINYQHFKSEYGVENVDMERFENYSAKAVTSHLVNLINRISNQR